MKRFVTILWICLSAAGAAAQSTGSKKALAAYQKAQEYIAAKNQKAAVSQLYLAIAEDNRFTEAYQVLGDVFRLQGDYINAVTNYRQVLKLDPAFADRARYGLGVSLFHLEEYAEAKTVFEKYLPAAGSDSRQLARVKKYIANCTFAVKAIASPVAFQPVNLGPQVNSVHDEYLPAVTVDGNTLVFTRKDQRGEDFFTSTSKRAAASDTPSQAPVSPVDTGLQKNRGLPAAGAWLQATPLSEAINSAAFNEGAESLSPDGQTIFFTICGRPDGLGSCDIYYSHHDGRDWSAPRNLGKPVNSPAWESQPSLSPDGKTLYFASNRAGTLGGIDLWKSIRQEDGTWSAPQNLGPQINTAYEEQSPFIHSDNQTLYFTSEGWPGMGGKDIYFSRKIGEGWEPATNIGFPINTSKDESSLVVSAGGEIAYFASNSLDGFGGYDLYTFEMPLNARPVFVSYIKGKVYDEATDAPLQARIQLVDLSTRELVFGSESNEFTGGFLASLPAGNNYAFNVSAPGYLFYSGSFFLEDKDVSDPFWLDIPLKKIAEGEIIVLNNIFFETGSYRLKSESFAELDKVIDFMRQNPSVTIELSGHTDNVGTPEDNQQLSESRAKAVYAYLIRAILKPARFRFRGYGETQPVADNSTEEGRAKNRRTELKIIAR